MGDASMRIIFVFTDLILPLVLGYYLHQRHVISDKGCNQLIRFNIVILSTVLSLLSFWVLPLSAGLLWLPLFGILFVLLPGIIGELTFARTYSDWLDRGAYMISAMLSNMGTLGGLCAFILYNEAGFAYSQIVVTFQNLMLVLVCFPLAQYYHARHTASTQKTVLRFDLRAMFLTWNQLSVLGMLAGLLLQAAGIERPPILGSFFQSLVHIGAWSALLPVGYLIDFHHARPYYHRVLNLIPLRFLIMPAAIFFISRLLFTDQILLGTLMILATTPTAINAVLTSRLYKLSVDLAVASFLITTILFTLLVFPLLFFYVQWGGQF